MSGYSALPVSEASPSGVALSFADARKAAAGLNLGSGAPAAAPAGSYHADEAELRSKLAGLKLAGGGLSDSDNSRFRRDKPSRIFRLQRGTRCFRFTLLFLVVIIVFSGYFQFDLPAITVNWLLPKLSIGMEQYSTIFVGYSVSNSIVPLLSGPFFGRFGKWRGVGVIASVITLGIAIVYAGIASNSYPVVVVGRTIYGLGGESVFVGVDILVTKWFAGAEIGFAYGLIQAAGQAGSFTALYTVPPMVAWAGGNIDYVFLASLGLSCTALALLGLARVLEKTAYGTRSAGPKTALGDGGGMHHDGALTASGAGAFAAAVMDGPGGHGHKADHAAAHAPGARAKPAAARGGAEETVSLLAAGTTPGSDGGGGGGEGGGAGGGEDDDEGGEEEADTDVVSSELQARLDRNLAYVRCIPPLFWLLNFLGVGHMVSLSWRFYAVMGGVICYSSAFYTFLAFGPAWLIGTYGMSEDEAGQTAGIIAIFSMVVSPSIGLVMDKRGGQRYVCFGAMLSACFWFAIMGYTRTAPAACIVFAGMSYSLLPASLYPLLPEFVPDESFTIVYAILNSLINVCFTIVLLIAGQVLGAGDVNSLAATRRVGGGLGVWAAAAARAAAAAAAAGAGGPPGLGKEEEGVANVQGFQYIFAMFVTITACGTLFTGALAYDGYRQGTGWLPLTNKH